MATSTCGQQYVIQKKSNDRLLVKEIRMARVWIWVEARAYMQNSYGSPEIHKMQVSLLSFRCKMNTFKPQSLVVFE